MCIPSVYSLKINNQNRIEEVVILSVVQICFERFRNTGFDCFELGNVVG